MSRKKALGADPLSWIKPTINTDINESFQPFSHSIGKDTRDSRQTQSSNEKAQRIQQEVEKKTTRANRALLPRASRQSRNPNIPKFQTYEVKLTIRLQDAQLQFLSSLERKIMRNRSGANRKERITKNSIIRAMIDVFQNLSVDTTEIGDEDELLRKLKRAVQTSESKITKA